MKNFNLNTNSGYEIINTGKNIILQPENEIEEKLLKEIEKTVVSKINRLSKSYDNVNIETEETKNRLTLNYCCNHFLDFKSNTIEKKQVYKYKQGVEYLYLFFGEKFNIKNIDIKQASEFQNFLLQIPKNYKHIKELKNKDIKKLILNKSTLLNNFEKQSLTTLNGVMKKVKTIFKYFEDNTFIYKNPFNNLPKLINGNYISSDWEEFGDKHLRSVFTYCNKNKLNEEYNFFKFTLYTGLRRYEILNIKVKHIDMDKCYINVYGTKSQNSKRIIVIHKDLKNLILKQIKNKNEEDYLFFNNFTNKYNKVISGKNKENRIGILLNDIIKTVVGEEEKHKYNIHSLRKNFSQQLFFSGLFTQLELKTLIGHSTKSDTTDKHYLRGKRDYKQLKEKIDKVDFSIYFTSIQPKKDIELNL